MISVNLQRDIFNNTKTIINDHLKKEKENLSKEYVGKHICIKKLCAEKFEYVGICLGIILEFKYIRNSDAAQKMFPITLIMDRGVNEYGDTSLNLINKFIHSFEAFETEDEALLYCEMMK